MFKDAPPVLFPMQKADARSERLLATRFSFYMLLSIFSIAYMDLRRKSKTVPMLCQYCGAFFIIYGYHFRSDFCNNTHFSLLNSIYHKPDYRFLPHFLFCQPGMRVNIGSPIKCSSSVEEHQREGRIWSWTSSSISLKCCWAYL